MKLADKITLKSWQKGIVYLIIWLIPSVGLKILADNVTGSLLLHVAYVMILLPASTLIITFIYAKNNGLKPWFIGYLTVAVLIMYLFAGFDTLSPNFLIVCAIFAFFGFGVGNVFKDEGAIAVQEDIDAARKKKRLKQEKGYVPILNDNPKSDNRRSKKHKRKGE